jgi:hypothetical protein
MIDLTDYCFSGDGPAQAILHDLSNEETNENFDVASNQSPHNNCTTIKRKNDMENIDNKRRKTEGKIMVIFFFLPKMSGHLFQ